MAAEDTTPAELQRLLEVQKAALRERGPPSVRERERRLDVMIQLLLANEDALVAAVTADFGVRPREVTRFADVLMALEAFKAARAGVRSWCRPERRRVDFPFNVVGATNYVEYQPKGVVGVIAPWNYPIMLTLVPVAGAIAAGNTVIWKPSEYAAVSCAMLGEIFKDAGVPDGVINIVQGKGDVGAALVDSKGVDGVFFTGSTATGRKIAEKCALRPHLLELGGDGPFIIMDDADVDAAVDGAMNGCFYYSGQVCTSAERVLVHEKVYDEFLEKLRAKAAALKIGNPAEEDTEMGPLCNKDTLARVKAHVDDAVAGERVAVTPDISVDRRL